MKLNRFGAILLAAFIALLIATSAFAAEPREYKKGTLDRWEALSGGTDCHTHEGLLGGVSTHCEKSGVRVYHLITEDGFDYTLEPDMWDPFKAMPLGQGIEYRVDEKGQVWTPDPTCAGYCKKRLQPKHEAKYFVDLVEKRKTEEASAAPKLTNVEVAEMSKLGLSETIIIAKIKASKPSFDLGVEALSSLKQKGVSDTVIAAMLERSSQ